MLYKIYKSDIHFFSNKEKELNNRRLAMQKIEGIKFFWKEEKIPNERTEMQEV